MSVDEVNLPMGHFNEGTSLEAEVRQGRLRRKIFDIFTLVVIFAKPSSKTYYGPWIASMDLSEHTPTLLSSFSK